MRWISWIVIIAVCLACAAALGLFKYNEIQDAIERGRSFPEPAEAVETYVVQQVARRPTLEVTGEIVATQSATLKNELAGRIVRVGFAPGAAVARDDVLLQLDISQEQAQLEEARAASKIAQLAFDRAHRLVQRGAGSVENRDQARAQLDATQARVAALGALIDKKTLRAPFDAVASLHELEVGQFLKAGTDITRLVGVADNIWVDFALPQRDAVVDLGGVVEIEFNDLRDRLSATVIARDPAVDVRSRNLRMRAQLPAASADLLPGMLVRVIVPLGETRMATVVPATAVRRDALGASVYVLEQVEENGRQNTRARQRRVELAMVRGSDGSETVVITDGLKQGETIAAIGAFKLRDGSLVVPGEAEPDAQERLVGL